MQFEIHVEYVNAVNEQYNTEKISNSRLTSLAGVPKFKNNEKRTLKASDFRDFYCEFC